MNTTTKNTRAFKQYCAAQDIELNFKTQKYLHNTYDLQSTFNYDEAIKIIEALYNYLDYDTHFHNAKSDVESLRRTTLQSFISDSLYKYNQMSN